MFCMKGLCCGVLAAALLLVQIPTAGAVSTLQVTGLAVRVKSPFRKKVTSPISMVSVYTGSRQSRLIS